ncbi:SpoIID/LytB domain-containing protein [Nocardioides sp. CN2-186]|uniref:SpoIID/LytB domain-containing protein n=1 Tax=Nocardioides tweenelious TaxID=3156607 RepID=UPI0032B522EA
MLLRRLVVLTSACLLVATAAPATAVAPHREPASVTISTMGNGHGKGLSQYGARNRAQDGQTYRQIVEHYYPETQWGTAGGTIRVLLTGAPSGPLVVTAQPGLRAHAPGPGKTWTLPAKRDGKQVKRWRIMRDGTHTSLAYKTGAWHGWRRATGDAEFTAGGKVMTLIGAARYRGTLRSTSSGVVNVLGLETYVRGVLSREVLSSWPAAALRSQAVAARTYAAFERSNVASGRAYDLCDTAECQVYGGADAEVSTTDAAVEATAGRIVTYDGAPAFAQFSASNAGYSVDGGYPYLVAEPDPYDHGYPGDPHPTTFTGDQVTRHWTGLGDLVSVEVLERDGNGPWGGRVTSVRINGTEGSQVTTGSALRSFLGLRTTLFQVS